MTLLDLRLRFLTLIEPLRFRKHARERLRQERQEEREHQLELLSEVMHNMTAVAEANRDAAIASANAAQELAKGFGTWLEMFKNANAAFEHVSSETVRIEDEAEAERQRELARLKSKGFPVDAPRNEQMLWILDNEQL